MQTGNANAMQVQMQMGCGRHVEGGRALDLPLMGRWEMSVVKARRASE
jgi:hypothetical protein